MRDRLLKGFCAFAVILLVTGCMGTPVSEQPDSDHPVDLENHGSEGATFDITVVRNATGEIVHNQSHVLDPGKEREVYNTDRASPNGIETFEIRWAARNETGQVTIKTNQCYGGAYVMIQEDGTASSTYSIC
ncbi:hypothetical protein SAMN04488556_0149 [Halostagnicola kamekurae]|uniref:Lipoprotein n=1 Tax=Halostagnicola kamekurae TaxID=619731 RepID=A0A1I6V9I3_9EURY|nr:hypothetical protein SAMN04488556_0149 [Halostagnicola kamekurae]